MGYRVDTVPWLLRPLYLAVTWTLGLLFYVLTGRTVRAAAAVEERRAARRAAERRVDSCR